VIERDGTAAAASERVLRARLAGGALVEARAVAPSAFPVALLRQTGSEGHLRKLEQVASFKQMTLAEEGLHRSGRPLALDTESDVYRELGLPFVPPELREDRGEVEAAVRGTLPAPLLRLEDVRGMVHCHTVYSDGRNTIEEMARGAEELGMEYLTITDHSPLASYAGGLQVDRLRRQWDEIARVQANVRVKLLRGTESDILADGALDYPDAVLDELDVIIASIHNRYRMDADQMTRRLVRTMRLPRFKVWGHALGRYVLRRPPIACRVEEVLDAAAESQVAIEINGNPHRLDLEPRWILEARERGLRFVVSTDAHSIAEMRNLRYGIDMARKGWLRKDDVLNTRDADAFRAAVRP
jgi:DNA polymerase (family 10)